MSRWRGGWLCGLLWIGLLGAAMAMPRVEMPPEVLGSADAVRIDRVESLASAARQPPGDDPATPWRAQALPDEWIRSRPGHSGTVWYRFTLHLPTDATAQAWALWVPKVAMNAELWVNGRLAGRHGRMDGPSPGRYWYTPLLFEIPPPLWQAGDNVIHLRVRARAPLQNGGLGPLSLARPEHLQPEHERRVWWQNHLVALCSMFVGSLGLFFLVLWVRQPRLRQYLYFGAAALALGLSSSNFSVNTAPVSDVAWEKLIHVVLLWGPLLLALFPLGFTQRHWPRAEQMVLGLGAVTTALMLVLSEEQWLPLWLGVMALAIALDAVALGWMLRYIHRERLLRDPLLLGVAALVMLGLGVHDMVLRIGWLPFDRAYGHPFMVPILLGALSWLIAGDYARAQEHLARAPQELAEHVRQREAELQATFARQAEAEREQATAAERSRILRDMHDGVGAHLTTAMRQLEAGHAEPALVAQTLRDSLDQLKLSIDAMNLPPGDVNALLASLRYRLQRRIESAGLVLHWMVETLPVWPAGQADPAAMRHLQFILFEGLSNALQHAQATEMTLGATVEPASGAGPAAICLTLLDNGRGLSADADPQAVLRTVRERARLLGAALRVEAGRPGTRVVLELPLGQATPGADATRDDQSFPA